MLKIFIGWDSGQAEPANVLKYSLEKHSSIPLDIRFLKLQELDFNRPLDPLQSTEFTYSRFLVPHLCGYESKAIFIDCDMLCLGDIKELYDLDMNKLSKKKLVKPNANGLQQAKTMVKRGRRNSLRSLSS